jgi:hypothetical protein
MDGKWIVLAALASLPLAACGTAPRQAGDPPVAAAGAMRAIPNGVAKTFAASVGDVRTAVLKSFLGRDVRVVFDSATEQGWRIWAVANERMMLIQLQRVLPTTTLMRVVIDQTEWDGEGFDIALPTTGAAPRAVPERI